MSAAEEASPAKQVPTVGLTPAQKREREEKRAAEERAKRDGPVAGQMVEIDGEQITQAEAIERVNQEEGGFLGKSTDSPPTEIDDDSDPAPEPEPTEEELIEQLPDTKEKLTKLVKELVGLKSDKAKLEGKLAIAVEKASEAFRARDAAKAEAEAYFAKYGPLD